MIARTVAVRWALCGVFISATSGHANVSLRPGLVSQGVVTVRVSESDSLTQITTDTGALAPGNRDFTRFTTPGECVGAVTVARHHFRRTIAAQLDHVMQDSSWADTIPAGAIQVARACASRFATSTTPPVDLPDLFTLALLAGHDSVARAVVERRVAVSANAGERDSVRLQAIQSYLDVAPSRIVAAEGLAAQLDSSGVHDPLARLTGHAIIQNFAAQRFDEPLMRREAEQIIALGHELPMAAIQYNYEPICWAFKALSTIAAVEFPDSDSVIAVIARAKRDLSRFRPGGEFPPGRDPGLLMQLPYRTASIHQILDNFVSFNPERVSKAAPLPPVTAAYWFPQRPASWPPGDGRPSLIIYGGTDISHGCENGDGILSINLLSGTCRTLYRDVPKLVKQYGDRLAITLVTQTHGGAVRSISLSPAAEADTLAWFFREHLKLPVTVGVVVDSLWRLPAVDGRGFVMDTTFYGTLILKPQEQQGFSPLVEMVYGKDGKLLYVEKANREPEIIQRIIARSLGATALPPLP